jgi:hypothetical protein
MALISVLLVTVVMLGLAGAFFIAHKSDLALMTSGTYREQTKNACLSVADFVQYKLQNDGKFGQEAFALAGDWPAPESFPPDSPKPTLEVNYIGIRTSPNPNSRVRNYIRGTMPESGVEFEVEILNNLSSYAPLSVTSQRTTPPRTCRAWITSRRGNVTQSIDFILKRSPFTNSSITSGNNIDVELANSDNGAWWLGSRQPSGNSVRASGNINGPEVWSPTGRAVLFTPPLGMEDKLEPPYGVMQGQTLTMQVDGVPKELMAGEDALKEAEDNIQGILSPGGGSVKVPELDRNNLQGAARKVTLPNAKLVFKTIEGPNGAIHVLLGDNAELARYDPMDHSQGGRYFTWENTPAADAVRMDLETREMAVAGNVELQLGDRSFQLRSEIGNNLDTTRQPTLVLGSYANGASLDAGNIDIEGSVAGEGALKSQSDLKIAAKSYLSTTPDFGIALHAKKDVVLTKPGINVTDGLAVDWSAYAEGFEASADNAGLNRWSQLSQEDRLALAASFKNRMLAESGDPEAFDAIWAGLTAELPADDVALAARDEWLKEGVPEVPPEMGPDLNWVAPPDDGIDPPEPTEPPLIPITEGVPAVPPGPGINIDRYIRMREYLRTVKSGQPNPSWLTAEDPAVKAQRHTDVTNLVSNQLSSFQLQAGQISTQVRGEVVLEWRTLGDYFSGNSNPFLASYTPDMVFRGLIYAGKDFIFDTEKKGVYIEGALVAHGNVSIKNATGANFVYNSDLLENLFATDPKDTSVPLERSYWAFY